MALNESNNLLLDAAHFRHTQPLYFSQNPLPKPVDLHIINHLRSSTQSLQGIFSLTSPSTSISYPHLQQLPITLSSTSTRSSHPVIHQNPSSSLVQASTSKINPLDEWRNKLSDEFTDSIYVSNATATTPLSEKNSSEMHVPIEIRVRCIFLRVGEIDTLNERYTSEIFFEASWYGKDPKHDTQTDHFNPQLSVLNHIGDSLRHDKWYSINKSTENGLIEVTEHHKFKGVFWERMELNHFPYDVQELSLSLTTPLTTKDIYFVEDKQKPSGVNRTVFSDEQSWYLYEHVEFQFEQHREEYSLNYDQIHPSLICTCHVGRKCGYYIWNAYFLIFLITSAALCTFAIPPSNAHGRLQITCTLLLTSVTFRWVVNKSLPTISYLTALDVYSIASIVALCLINVFHGVVSYIYYDQIYFASYLRPVSTNALHLSLYPTYALCRLDRYGFFILSIAFCVYQILILLWTFWTPFKRRQEMQRKDETNRAKFMHKLGNHQ